MTRKSKQILIVTSAVTGLTCVYIFQNSLDQFFNLSGFSGYKLFLMARAVRFLLNDILMILLIYGLFENKKYVLFAFYLQLVGILFVFMPYMIIKYYTSYDGPLLSFLHRLIINPLLLLLLIPAFYYQEKYSKNRTFENEK